MMVVTGASALSVPLQRFCISTKIDGCVVAGKTTAFCTGVKMHVPAGAIEFTSHCFGRTSRHSVKHLAGAGMPNSMVTNGCIVWSRENSVGVGTSAGVLPEHVNAATA
jgi:hypothetical protein